METAICRPLIRALAIASFALLVAACGGNATAGPKPAFAWLSARSAPAGWPTARIPSGAAMSYPPGWKRITGDRGTASVALVGGKSALVGYLNLTPRQGGETIANWTHFRVAHNREEGDRDVATLARASGRPFGDGRASCVEDSYATTTGAHYIEIACLAAGRRGSVVIVGASPAQAWKRISPQLERAISALSV